MYGCPGSLAFAYAWPGLALLGTWIMNPRMSESHYSTLLFWHTFTLLVPYSSSTYSTKYEQGRVEVKQPNAVPRAVHPDTVLPTSAHLCPPANSSNSSIHSFFVYSFILFVICHSIFSPFLAFLFPFLSGTCFSFPVPSPVRSLMYRTCTRVHYPAQSLHQAPLRLRLRPFPRSTSPSHHPHPHPRRVSRG